MCFDMKNAQPFITNGIVNVSIKFSYYENNSYKYLYMIKVISE